MTNQKLDLTPEYDRFGHPKLKIDPSLFRLRSNQHIVNDIPVTPEVAPPAPEGGRILQEEAEPVQTMEEPKVPEPLVNSVVSRIHLAPNLGQMEADANAEYKEQPEVYYDKIYIIDENVYRDYQEREERYKDVPF